MNCRSWKLLAWEFTPPLREGDEGGEGGEKGGRVRRGVRKGGWKEMRESKVRGLGREEGTGEGNGEGMVWFVRKRRGESIRKGRVQWRREG